MVILACLYLGIVVLTTLRSTSEQWRPAPNGAGFGVPQVQQPRAQTRAKGRGEAENPPPPDPEEGEHATRSKRARDTRVLQTGARPAARPLLSSSFLDRFLVVPEYKLLYCDAENTGGAMFHHLFRMLRWTHPRLRNNAAEATFQAEETRFRNTPVHHNLSAPALDELLQDPGWTKAVFYRDPVPRFSSAYRASCEGADPRDGPSVCARAFGTPSIAFDAAVRALGARAFHRAFLDPRFAPQSAACGGLAHTIRYYDLVEELRADTVEGHVRALFDRIGVGASTAESLIASVVRTGGTDLDGDRSLVNRLYDSSITLKGGGSPKATNDTQSGSYVVKYYKNQGMIDVIQEVYRIDYETFNIPVPPADTAQRMHSDNFNIPLLEVDTTQKTDYDAVSVPLPPVDTTKGYDSLMVRLGVHSDAAFFQRTMHPFLREFVSRYQSRCSDDGPEATYLGMLQGLLQESGTQEMDARQCPLVVLFLYETGAGPVDRLVHFHGSLGTHCIQFVVPKQYQQSEGIAKLERLGYTFLRSTQEEQHPVINEALDMLRASYGPDTLVSVNDIDHLLVWRAEDGRLYRYTSYREIAMLYLHAFLSTDGCRNKNVQERFLSPCTCMLENNTRYVPNEEAVFSEYGVENWFHPTMNFYIPTATFPKLGTVFSNLHPPLEAVAHHTMGDLPVVFATHPAVLHLRRSEGTIKAIDKYANFLLNPKRRNPATHDTANINTAVKCAVGSPDVFSTKKEKQKRKCMYVKELSNMFSILHQRRLCTEAGYSTRHCESDLSCCVTRTA